MQLTDNGYVGNIGRESNVTDIAKQQCETLFGLIISTSYEFQW